MAITATTALLINLAITAGSAVYQRSQQKKARSKAAAAAEARKGFQLVFDSGVGTMPFAYGRVKVGGRRVYHKTSSDFRYTPSNADKVFIAGSSDIPSFTYQEDVYVGDSYTTQDVTTAVKPGSMLTKDVYGTKNEFLHFEQALCIGPIQGIYDVVIEDSIGLDDPQLGQTISDPLGAGDTAPKASLRLDCHYGDTAVADAIATANFPDRANAKFPGLSWVSAFFRINRDDPAFSAVPSVAFYLEGRKVREVANGALSTARTYSNSSPLVLLDYLLDPNGRNIPTSKVDLPSFEAGHILGRRTVISNAIVGGSLWKPVDGSRNVNTTNIHLFEFNGVLDTGRKARENIDAILATMGNAELVWSQGKYKLQVQAPMSNESLTLAAELTDDDLYSTQITESWPSATDRVNYATIRFNNEFLDFKEDSASWPPKKTGVIFKGINGNPYPVVSGWDEVAPTGALLNRYGVWAGAGNATSLSWKFVTKNSGAHSVKFVTDNTGTISITGPGVSVNGSNNLSGVTELSFNANDNAIITVAIAANNAQGIRGVAAEIIDSQGFLVWSSRDPAYTDFIQTNQTSTIYDTFLEEDNGQVLETEEFAEGISDPYHALAKAEERVRTSRSNNVIKFTHIIRSRILERGDYVKLDSDTLKLYNFYGRVVDVKPRDDALADITLTRFDWTQLAWNVEDDTIIPPTTLYDFKVRGPEWVRHSPITNVVSNSAGKVTWAAVADSRIVEYIIYIHKALDSDAGNYPIFTEIGRTTSSSFELPAVTYRTGRVGVRARTLTGLSEMTISEPVIFSSRSVKITYSQAGFITDNLAQVVPSTITLTARLSGYANPVIEWLLNNTVVGTAATLVLTPFALNTTNNYTVRVEEQDYLSTDETLLTDNVNIFSLESGQSSIALQLSNDNHNVSATSTGEVITLAGASTLVSVLQGPANVTSDWDISRTSSSGITSTLNGNSSETHVVTESSNVEIVVTAMSTDSGFVDVVATKDAQTLTKRFSLTKTRAGVASLSTFTAVIYKAAETAPENPSGGSYNFTTRVLTPPATWSSTPPSIDSMPIWQCSYLFSTANPSIAVIADEWSESQLYSLPPVKAAQLTIYKRSAGTPTLPSIETVYTFDTNVLDGLNNSWSQTIPAGSDPLWAAVATASNWTATDTVLASEWSSPVQVSGTGASGFSTATVFLLRRTTTNTPPNLPTVSLTYTFATGGIAGNTNGWETSLPNTGGGYCWMTSAAAISQETTDVIAPGEWAAPSMITTDGVPSPVGTQATLVAAYKWSTTQPEDRPAGNSTYTWESTDVTFTTPNGWSGEVTTNPGVPGIKLWVLYKRLTAPSVDTTTTFNWNDNVFLVYVSANGEQGTSGPKSAVAAVYQWALTIPTISGSSSYSWSTNLVTDPPSGWSAIATGGEQGQTLWEARFTVVSAPNATTETVSWASANIVSIGYKGNDTGIAGNSARRAYTITTADSLGVGPVTTNGNTSLPDTNSAFGNGLSWTAQPGEPAAGTNQKLFQSDGIYSPATGLTVWYRPYLASLKVGSLSALAVNTGALTVNEGITFSNSGFMRSGNFTGYGWPTPNGVGGFYLDKSGLLIGNATAQQRIEITAEGNLFSPGFSIVNGQATFSGTLSAPSGTINQVTLGPTGFIRLGQVSYDSGYGFFLGRHNGQNVFSIRGTTGAAFKFDGTNIILENITFGDVFAASLSASNGVIATVALSFTGGKAPYNVFWLTNGMIYSETQAQLQVTAFNANDPAATYKVIAIVSDSNGRSAVAGINVSAGGGGGNIGDGGAGGGE